MFTNLKQEAHGPHHLPEFQQKTNLRKAMIIP